MTSVKHKREADDRAADIGRVETAQSATWKSDFGRAYTDRNTFDIDALNALYLKNYGVTRTQINEWSLRNIPKEASILEVGCNAANQLILLQQMGYSNLSGVELQPYALEMARSRTRNISLRQGSALALPYEDTAFDLVFTSGVLIHLAPEDLSRAMDEIHRCARKYIWGMEYYAPEATDVNYRSHGGLLWKMDYTRRYLERFDDLQLVQEQRLRYLEGANVDTVFLFGRKRLAVAVEAP
jgi:pseudaminic acid biosynthesis-associated methylase